MDRIEREIAVAAPVAKVWRLVSTSDQLARWFPGAVIVAREGAAATFDCGAEELFHGVVERVEPPHVLAWRWCLAPGVPVERGPSTTVTVTLAADGAGTRIRLVESGFAALEEEIRKLHQPGNASGWELMLKSLAEHAGR